MTDSGRAALSKLREIRDVLGRDGAPRRINLRNYAEPGTPAWEAFVEASGLPGHKVRRATMVARINKAIDVLTAQLLGTEAPPERSPPPDGGQPPRSERQRLRRLTPDGVARAREFLSGLRDNPAGAIEPPPDLLHDDRYAPRFVGEIEVQRRSFRTRRQVAEYFGPLLEPIAHLVADHAGVWSWLGMFYFAETVRKENGIVRLSPLDATFVVDPQDVSSRSYQLRYRHYLWGSWRLYEQHGDNAAFLLEKDLTWWGDIAERSFGSIRIFNSVGIIPLILRLYTNGAQQKRGFNFRRGGLRHLIRVLDQLERTYDVYGMEPDALLRILPEEFRQWDEGPGVPLVRPQATPATAAARQTAIGGDASW